MNQSTELIRQREALSQPGGCRQRTQTLRVLVVVRRRSQPKAVLRIGGTEFRAVGS